MANMLDLLKRIEFLHAFTAREIDDLQGNLDVARSCARPSFTEVARSEKPIEDIVLVCDWSVTWSVTKLRRTHVQLAQAALARKETGLKAFMVSRTKKKI